MQNPSSKDLDNKDAVVYAFRLAFAFDSWQNLNKQLEADPRRVTPEQMAAAWTALLEAHERWASSR